MIKLKVLIIPLVAIVVVLLSIVWIKPLISTYLKNKEERIAIEQKYRQAVELQSGLDIAREKFEDMSEDRALVDFALPSEENGTDFASELNSKANKSGALVVGLSEADATASFSSGQESSSYICSKFGQSSMDNNSSTNYSSELAVGSGLEEETDFGQICADRLIFKLEFRGDWSQVLKLFEYISDMNRVANVSVYSISSLSEDGQNTGLLSGSMEVAVFTKKESKRSDFSMLKELAQTGFNNTAIQKAHEMIFAPFVVPEAPAASAGRNPFTK